LWRASCSSMWSRKPTPVATSYRPVPSRLTDAVIDVSLVTRSTFAVRARVALAWVALAVPAMTAPATSPLARGGFVTAYHGSRQPRRRGGNGGIPPLWLDCHGRRTAGTARALPKATDW